MSIAAPVEPEKAAFLHDRTNRPVAPAPSRLELGKRWAAVAVGVVLSVGLTAVLFSLRDSWENHREWLVTTIPLLVIAGVALAHLAIRQQIVPLVPAATFLVLALTFGGADLFLDAEDGSNTARDTLSILGGICLGFAVAGLVFALLWVELRNPTKAPTPDL